MTVYMDCNATSPIEPAVGAEVLRFLTIEFGNSGSRTHEFGARAKQAVQRARTQVAAVVSAAADEVVFTSGATESNNLSLFGLASHGDKTKHRHIVSTMIEHKAVLEPLEALSKRGFEVTLIRPNSGGWVDPEDVRHALRPDTLLVSVMHANNETGVIQPLTEIVNAVRDHEAYLHVDAAQGFGKDLVPLKQKRIDLISISGHKIYGPKGVGALVIRRRGYERVPLEPLFFGGGQERGLRPGTLPVPLVVGFGMASDLALKNHKHRADANASIRQQLLTAIAPLNPAINGDQNRVLSNVVNVSFPGLDSEAVMVVLKKLVAISNGSACTSHKYEPSHVLNAMGLSKSVIQGALRFSWCHMTGKPDWKKIVTAIKSIQ